VILIPASRDVTIGSVQDVEIIRRVRFIQEAPELAKQLVIGAVADNDVLDIRVGLGHHARNAALHQHVSPSPG
jgi:hypothetical protein